MATREQMQWPSRTLNGFYIGDEVQLPNGRTSFIEEGLVERCTYWDFRTKTSFEFSVVRLTDGFVTSDIGLTRIG